MDRKTQLANVAFGGSWVDAIEAREDLAKALDAVRTACSDCMERDVRDTALRDALDYLAPRMARGEMIIEAFWRAVGLEPERRARETTRLLATILSGIGVAKVSG